MRKMKEIGVLFLPLLCLFLLIIPINNDSGIQPLGRGDNIKG